jgi:hypothetical protein
MHIDIVNGEVVVKLSWLETILSLRRKVVLPISKIQSVSLEKPKVKWALRVGTGVPFYFYAGLFYTDFGREFWYRKVNREHLTIVMKNNKPFRRVSLTIDNPERMYSLIKKRL